MSSRSVDDAGRASESGREVDAARKDGSAQEVGGTRTDGGLDLAEHRDAGAGATDSPAEKAAGLDGSSIDASLPSQTDSLTMPKRPTVVVRKSATQADTLEYRLAVAVLVEVGGTGGMPWTVHVDGLDGTVLASVASFACH